jgi:protein subunit release factor B
MMRARAIVVLTAPCWPITPLRRSQISSFSRDGYYRLQWKEVEIDPSCYEVVSSRGSGPGGQGANSSSNKVELRVDLELLGESLEEGLLQALKRNEGGKSITSDGTTLIVSSYEQRSAHANKEACLRRVKQLIAEASWVPPVPKDPIQLSDSTITRHKLQRRIRGNALKARSAARRGLW